MKHIFIHLAIKNKKLCALLLAFFLIATDGHFAAAEDSLFYVRDYGAQGDGYTNDQVAIQLAVNDAYNAGGGIVIFDQNRVYYTSTIYLKSNVVLDIESGSKIKASTQASDYDYANCELDPVGVCDRISPLLFADNVENIGIQGQGIIEGVGMTLYCASGQLCEWGNCGYGITAIFYGDVSNGFITNIRVQNTGGGSSCDCGKQ